MDTIHPPSGSCHSHSRFKLKSPPSLPHSLRPFSNQLPAYTAYTCKLLHLRSKAPSVRAMTKALRERAGLHRLRLRAQLELQNVYDHIAFGLGLPRIPVRLPLRKRIRAAGLASFLGNTPREIRIFPITGHAAKIRRHWKPADLAISPPALVCEIFLHETAHIHAAHFTKTWDHGLCFIKSYMAIERVMLGFGFRPLLTDALRFAGCPPDSAAAKLRGTARQSKSLDSGV